MATWTIVSGTLHAQMLKRIGILEPTSFEVEGKGSRDITLKYIPRAQQSVESWYTFCEEQ